MIRKQGFMAVADPATHREAIEPEKVKLSDEVRC